MKKTLLAAALILSACGPNGAITGLAKQGTQAAVGVLTPICANLVEDRDIIPDIAKGVGIDEEAVCDCGLRKAEVKLTAQPQLAVDILQDEEARNTFMIAVATECAGELLQKAVNQVTNPNASNDAADTNASDSNSSETSS